MKSITRLMHGRVAAVIPICLLSVIAAACATTGSSRQDEVAHFPVPGNAQLPFSEAVRVGKILYLSGQVGTRSVAGDTGMELVAGGIEAETRQTMENIRAVLERYGSSLDRVVKCTVLLADMSEWGDMNSVYVTYFPKHLPARTALGASGLALGARVEIECMATVD